MGLFGLKRDRAKQKAEELLDGAEAPSFKESSLRVLDRLRDPNVEFDQVAEALRWDPGLTLKVLAVANSAAYSPRQKISDVRHAVSFLGRAKLEQLALAIAVGESLPKSAARGFDPKRFWLSSARRAGIAQQLSQCLHPAHASEAFTAGLLQDLAVPVLAHTQGERYGELLEEWHASPTQSLDELERKEFGWDHGHLGGLLCASWEVPESISKLVALHHRSDAGDRQLLPAIRLVSVLAETEAEHGDAALIELASGDYGLEEDTTRAILSEAAADAEELARTLAG